MSSQRVESLEYPTDDCQYFFEVHHAGSCFFSSGWIYDNSWRVFLGNAAAICTLINSDNPSCADLTDWEFSIKVKDSFGNVSPESEKLKIFPTTNLPPCYNRETYTKLLICSSTDIPTDDCDLEDSITVLGYHEDYGYGDGDGTKIDVDMAPLDVKLGVSNIPLVPEFGLFIGALTIMSAVGVFFLVRRE